MSNNGKMNKVFRDFHINKNADKFFGNLQKKKHALLYLPKYCLIGTSCYKI